MPRPDYDSPEWADVVPIPQDEGGPNPIAAIAYSDEYSQCADYLRAVMAAHEKSPRVLQLTEHMINMNPAHYTVWYKLADQPVTLIVGTCANNYRVYRASVLEALGTPPEEELEWLSANSLKHLKNYQIWQHRQVIMSRLQDIPPTETEFLAKVLSKDTKNYHVWSYRQWLVKHFDLWAEDGPGGEIELDYTTELIQEDVRNNSAWNHRYFILFNKPELKSLPVPCIEREIQFAKDQIRRAPQNQSSWNYLKAVLRFSGRSVKELKKVALMYAAVEESFDVTSSYALDILADIWTAEMDVGRASKALDLLGSKYDPIRKNYWEWRKSKLAKSTG